MGSASDRRITHPHDTHPDQAFGIPIASQSDSSARYICRPEELVESLNIMLQILKRTSSSQLSAGSVPVGRRTRKIQMESTTLHFRSVHGPPQYDSPMAHTSVEAPKGEFGPTTILASGTRLARSKIRSPGYHHPQPLDLLSKALQLSDSVTTTGTLDPVPGEIDRQL